MTDAKPNKNDYVWTVLGYGCPAVLGAGGLLWTCVGGESATYFETYGRARNAMRRTERAALQGFTVPRSLFIRRLKLEGFNK